MRMSRVLSISVLSVLSLPPSAVTLDHGEKQRPDPTALADLVELRSPLAAHRLVFDATFARLALDYLHSGDRGMLKTLAQRPAANHLLNHANTFGVEVPKDSPQSLIEHLMKPQADSTRWQASCEHSYRFFTGPMLDDPSWVHDVLRYLPDGFRFNGSLFLTFGYDIGVAIGPNASLNGAHSHFDGHPRELLYLAIHELHHVGYMSYQPLPPVASLKTCRDLLKFVQHATQMEGMAVLAAYDRRRVENALAGDDDYLALTDEIRMQRDEKRYFEDCRFLMDRGDQAIDQDAWAVIERMSSGDRLWYRVGARISQRIEKAEGLAALVDLIKRGPSDFMDAYGRITSKSK